MNEPSSSETPGWLATTVTIVSFFQTLQLAPKIAVTFLSIALFCGAMFVLWFVKPLKQEDKAQRQANISSETQVNTSNQMGGKTVGKENSEAISIGQSGGINAGVFNQYPPSSEQQKEEARSRLRAELIELAEFPLQTNPSTYYTQLETLLNKKTAIVLYNILSEKYYKETILSLPDIGPGLRAFQKRYYDFRQSEKGLEGEMRNEIIKLSPVHIDGAWDAILIYALKRNVTGSPKEVIQQVTGSALSMWGVQNDDAEKVLAEINSEKIKGRLLANANELQALSADADRLLQALH